MQVHLIHIPLCRIECQPGVWHSCTQGARRDLREHIVNTVERRLVGSGLGDAELDALAAYVKDLPGPGAPPRPKSAAESRREPRRGAVPVGRGRLRALPRRRGSHRQASARYPVRRDVRYAVAAVRRRHGALFSRRPVLDASRPPRRHRRTNGPHRPAGRGRARRSRELPSIAVSRDRLAPGAPPPLRERAWRASHRCRRRW